MIKKTLVNTGDGFWTRVKLIPKMEYVLPDGWSIVPAGKRRPKGLRRLSAGDRNCLINAIKEDNPVIE